MVNSKALMAVTLLDAFTFVEMPWPTVDFFCTPAGFSPEKIHSVAVKPAASVHFGPPPPSAIRWKFDTSMLNPNWTAPPPNPGSMYNYSIHIVVLLHGTPLYIAFIKVLYIILHDFYPPRCSKDSVAACRTA